jgi:hypothetical protein
MRAFLQTLVIQTRLLCRRPACGSKPPDYYVPDYSDFRNKESRMNPRIRRLILHWLDVLTWPASLILKVLTAAFRVTRRSIRQHF